MRAIELKLSEKVFQVVSVDIIRQYSIKSINIENVKDVKSKTGRGKDVITVKMGDYGDEYLGHPDSHFLIGKKSGCNKIFTTLEAAQKHQLRRRKKELAKLLEKFKVSRSEYETFKLNYKNKPASNPE